jgi:hypothetical protein
MKFPPLACRRYLILKYDSVVPSGMVSFEMSEPPFVADDVNPMELAETVPFCCQFVVLMLVNVSV